MPYFPIPQALLDMAGNAIDVMRGLCPDFVDAPEDEQEPKPVRPFRDHPVCIGAVDDPSVCYWCDRPIEHGGES